MLIEVSELQEPLHIAHAYRPEEIKFEHTDAHLLELVRFEATLTRKDIDVRVTGGFKTMLDLVCSRCLRHYTAPLDREFDLFYEPLSSMSKSEESEVKYDDLLVAYYDGVMLDVDLIVLEQLQLSVPMKPICRDDCKGLCEICGADLNTETCECSRDRIDERFRPLLDLKKKLKPQ